MRTAGPGDRGTRGHGVENDDTAEAMIVSVGRVLAMDYALIKSEEDALRIVIWTRALSTYR